MHDNMQGYIDHREKDGRALPYKRQIQRKESSGIKLLLLKHIEGRYQKSVGCL